MEQPTRSPGDPLGRRSFLKGAGAGVVVLASGFPDWLSGQIVRASLGEVDGVLTATLYRPEDQTWLRFEFVDLRIEERDTGPTLVPDGDAPTIVVHLPAQHLAEATVPVGSTPGTAALAARAAGESRLVYPVGAEGAIPLTSTALLSMAGRRPRVATAAGDPEPLATMFELPADIRSSPSSAIRVRADVTPLTHGGVTQLGRLLVEDPDGPARFRPLFAAPATNDPPGRVPDAGDRTAIVAAATSPGAPMATANRLWFTLHGAWAEIEADWTNVQWIHSMTGGRDLFVQVTRRGFAMPFGVPAVWVTTSARVWVADNRGGLVAALVSEEYVSVPDTALDWIDADAGIVDPAAPVPNAPDDGRRMPFRRIHVDHRPATRAAKVQLNWPGGNLNTDVAWAVHDTSVFQARIHQAYELVDVADHDPVAVAVPLVFVAAEHVDTHVVAGGLRSFYDANPVYTTASLSEDLAWAPEVTPGTGITTLRTTKLVFGVDHVTAPTGAAVIWPVISSGRVQVPMVGAPPRQVDVSFAERWVDHATDPGQNPDLAFLELGEELELPLGKEARAVMTPDLTATVFNQTFGIGADPVIPAPGSPNGASWNPSDAFGDGAQILGRFALNALVDAVSLAVARPGIDIPALQTDLFPLNAPTELRTTQEWCPDHVNSIEPLGFIADDDTSLCVRLFAVVALDPTVTPRSEVTFTVRDFSLHLPPVLAAIELDVAELRVTQPSNGPVDLVFEVEDWRLGQALSWLRPLIDLFTPGGSGMDIDIASDAIEAELSLPIPDINLGVLKISNVGVDVGATFPFEGGAPPMVSVDVGKPSSPISLRIMQFRGAFFTRIRFTPDGLELLRIKVEAAARLLEIDIVIATAYCEVGVAAEFRWDSDGIIFTGSIWLEASFDVLGVISATLRITGAVTYQQALERIRVKGTISWSVTALFTAKGEVEIGTLTFALGGGNASTAGIVGTSAVRAAPRIGSGSPDSDFGAQHTVDTWRDYVDAFAA